MSGEARARLTIADAAARYHQRGWTSLDPNVERPELRTFRGDPVSTVLENRGRYIAAVLTIVRAYIAASYPNRCPPLASFGEAFVGLINGSAVVAD